MNKTEIDTTEINTTDANDLSMIGFNGQLMVSKDLPVAEDHVKMTALSTLMHTMGMRSGAMMGANTGSLETAMLYALTASTIGLSDSPEQAAKRLGHHLSFMLSIMQDLKAGKEKGGQTCFDHFKAQYARVLENSGCTIETPTEMDEATAALAAMPAKGNA